MSNYQQALLIVQEFFPRAYDPEEVELGLYVLNSHDPGTGTLAAFVLWAHVRVSYEVVTFRCVRFRHRRAPACSLRARGHCFTALVCMTAVIGSSFWHVHAISYS